MERVIFSCWCLRPWAFDHSNTIQWALNRVVTILFQSNLCRPFGKGVLDTPSCQEVSFGSTIGDYPPNRTVDFHTSVCLVENNTPKQIAIAKAQTREDQQKGRSPINVSELTKVLNIYPKTNWGKVSYMVFKIGYSGPRKAYRCRNLKSVTSNIKVARE